MLGRVIARRDLGDQLAVRLQLQDWHSRVSELADERIAAPVFIVGMARTGTTILHELLALDPANRIPLTWEVDAPFPPPESASYATDPRIAQVAATLDRTESLIPHFKQMHRMGAKLPQECVRITARDFVSMQFTASFRVPGYTRWLLDEADLAPAYRNHRRMLQLLQWRCPAERWVLKTPAHLWSLPALLAEYPDALLIQTHRDPLKVLSSLTSLETTLRAMGSDAVDPHAIAREWSEWCARAFERSVAFRESGALPPERVVDTQFREFIADPVAVVERIYRHFGFELPASLAERMRRYVASNPSDRDGRHRHGFEDTGLDRDEERERVRAYQARFDVPDEEIS